MTEPRTPMPGTQPSDRELYVLNMLARGEKISKIAADLGVSPYTVKRHASRLYVRLGASNRANAVALGCLAGYVTVGSAHLDLAAKAPKPSRSKPGIVVELPPQLFDSLIAVLRAVTAGQEPASLRKAARRVLLEAQSHARNPARATGKPPA